MNMHVADPCAARETRAGAHRRLLLLSDMRVHEEPWSPTDMPPGLDAVVVAGNVRPGLAATLRWLDAAFDRRGDAVLALVPGPLEFEDGMPVPEALAQGAGVARETGIVLLHDASVRIGRDDEAGLHLVGATLWPDFSLAGPGKVRDARNQARGRWTSCRKTAAAPNLPFLPHDAAGAHARSRAFLEDALRAVWANAEGFGGKPPVVTGIRGGDRAVVATAFPPLGACLPPELAHPLLDQWRPTWAASDLRETFSACDAPASWLHGGAPHALDLRIGRTRVVANPRGLPPTGFDLNRIVAI